MFINTNATFFFQVRLKIIFIIQNTIENAGTQTVSRRHEKINSL